MFIDILQLNGVHGVRGGPGAVVPSSVEQVRGHAQGLVTPTTLVRKDWNVLARRLKTVFVTTVKVCMYMNMLELQIIYQKCSIKDITVFISHQLELCRTVLMGMLRVI